MYIFVLLYCKYLLTYFCHSAILPSRSTERLLYKIVFYLHFKLDLESH